MTDEIKPYAGKFHNFKDFAQAVIFSCEKGQASAALLPTGCCLFPTAYVEYSNIDIRQKSLTYISNFIIFADLRLLR